MISRVNSGNGFQNDVDADLSISYSVASGSNRLLVGGFSIDSGSPFVSFTFNSVALTKDKEQDRPTVGSPTSIWSLVAPDVGTFNLIATKTGSVGIVSIVAANYTGCLQTGQPDATSGASSNSASSASYTHTTVADDCWIVTSEYDNIGGIVDGTNFVQVTSSTNGIYLGDSNGSVGAAGSKTVAFSWGGSGPYRAASASYAPAADVASVFPNLLLMGAG